MTTGMSFSSLLTSCTFESGDWAPGRRPYNQDCDDVRRSFRVAEKFPTPCLVSGRQGPPADYKEHVSEARFQFLVCNVHSACALKAGWEASPSASIYRHAFPDEGIASGGNRRHRRMCSCGPRPSTTRSVVGGSRSESTWHKSLAAVTSGQVDFKKEGLAMESCGKGDLSYHNRRFNCVQLKFCGLVERRAALDSLSRLVHQLDQLTVNGKFRIDAETRCANERRTLRPWCTEPQCSSRAHDNFEHRGCARTTTK